jgi:mannosyltransferase
VAPAPGSNRSAIVPVALVLLLALGLRVFHVGAASLWIDEIFSLRDAEAITAFNRIRPLYYLLLRAWMVFGDSEAWLRLPSVVFGVAAVAVLCRLGRELADQATGTVAAVLFAISPMAVDHSQQVRMYMLGALLGLMGSVSLSRTLDQRGRSFWAWGLCRLLMIATAPLNGALLAADAVIVWRDARARPEVLRKFGTAVLLPLAWLPVLVFVYLQPTSEEPIAWLRHVSRPYPSQILAQLVAFAVTWPTSADTVASFHSAVVARAHDFLGLLLLLLLLLGMDDKERPGLGRATIWATVPVLLFFVASQGSRSLWVERYLLFVAPYVLLLVAAGLVRAFRFRAALAEVAGLALLLGAASGLHHYYFDIGREDWRGAIAAISDRERPNDLVVLPETYCQSALRHYHPTQIASMPIGIPDPFGASASEVREALQRLPRSRRLWLVYRRVSVPGQQETFGRAVRAELNVEWQQSFPGIDVFLVTPSPGPS